MAPSVIAQYISLEFYGPLRLVGSPSGLLTSSFVPYGRSSRVTQGESPERDGGAVVGLGQAYYEVGMNHACMHDSCIHDTCTHDACTHHACMQNACTQDAGICEACIYV